MYLFTKFGDRRCYRNGDMNFHINSYMDNLTKAELTASIHHTARFLKPGILIYNTEVSIRLAEKEEEEEGHSQLQSVFRFM